MTTTTLNIRVDSDIKSNAQKLFAQFGLDMTSAINMFLRQALRERAIPFAVTARVSDAPQTSVKTPKFGSAKGKIWMADDFDAPLEDFAEYM